MYFYIVNPAAGKGAINNLEDKLRNRLNDLGISGEFFKTTGVGDATKVTKTALEKGATTIVAVGGDETVNEVINGLRGDQAALGIIPIGNSNRLASHFGITGWQQACDVLAARRINSYALIAAGQKFFLSSLTVGFETELDKNLDKAETRSERVKSLWAGLGRAQHFEPMKCHIRVDDKYELEAPIFSLKLVNQKFLDPLASNELTITLADKPSRRELTSFLWQHKRGGSLEEAVSTRIFAKRVVITTDPPGGIMIDGKLAGRTPIAVRLTDRKIRFIAEKQLSNIKAVL